MNENKFSSLIRFLFAEERKQIAIAPNKLKKILADLWKKAGNVLKTKGHKNEQSENCRTGEKSTKG